jgi:diguanylate cyclase (GGDEF)-like protein
MVYKDHLTNIGNRAYYEATIHNAIEQNNRTHQGLSLIILDINNFKPINDTYGHLKGDDVLKAFSQVLTKSVRTSDMIFRIGGDEFAIILAPAESCSIIKVHQRLLREIEHNPLLNEVGFSTSIGCSHWEIGMNASKMFEQADQQLYLHKASTRAKS